jgi:hypothetical protein
LTVDGAPLADDQVQRAVEAAVASGSVVVTGADEVPDGLPVIVVTDGPSDDERAVTAGDLEPTATVAGIAALIAAQGRTPAEIGEVLVNTARGEDRTVDAAAAVEQAGNLAAGGGPTPIPPEESKGGLSPATIGLLAVGAATIAVGGSIWFGSRRPRQRPPG